MINTINALQAVRSVQSQLREAKEELDRAERELHFLYVELSQQKNTEDFEKEKQINDLANQRELQIGPIDRPKPSKAAKGNSEN